MDTEAEDLSIGRQGGMSSRAMRLETMARMVDDHCNDNLYRSDEDVG